MKKISAIKECKFLCPGSPFNDPFNKLFALSRFDEPMNNCVKPGHENVMDANFKCVKCSFDEIMYNCLKPGYQKDKEIKKVPELKKKRKRKVCEGEDLPAETSKHIPLIVGDIWEEKENEDHAKSKIRAYLTKYPDKDLKKKKKIPDYFVISNTFGGN